MAKRLDFCLLLVLFVEMILLACQGTPTKNEPPASENAPSQPVLKVLEPEIGATPDISDDAAKNLRRARELFAKIDSVISTYPDYETAKQHLTERQIEIWENQEEYLKEDHLDVSIWGCSWYCGGGPDSIFASSTLSPIKRFNYEAGNAHDFSLRTAWVEGVAGYGIGESITFRFPKQSPPVTRVEIYNGYMKSEKTWKDNSRVKQLKVYVNDRPSFLLNLKDIHSKQIFSLDTLQGTDEDLYLKFEITDVYKGDKYEDVAIAEIEFDGIGVHCFAEGTLVATPSGAIEIENLKAGDEILSLNESTRQIEVSKVLELSSRKHHNLCELDFSGTVITVTDDHPFYFNGKFYSVKANEKYGVQTNALREGQPIAFLTATALRDKKLTAIRPLNSCRMAYAIVRLDKNRLFFANGLCAVSEQITTAKPLLLQR
ncbi:MAG: Hint domain-containing protein [Saprospiraceae bacterium]|nr:Hint domain-containing protein [Saprospiraceae bacterium]MDW8230919.1 Hint domain-containing protein [Saprospiraceae bacterium]